MDRQQNSDWKERRKFKRVADAFPVLYKIKFPFAVHIQFGGSNCDAIAQDIGEGGIGLLTNYEIPSGTVANLKFKVFNDLAVAGEETYHAFDVDGDIRSSILVPEEKSYRLGISFVEVSSADRNFIAGYVKSQSMKP